MARINDRALPDESTSRSGRNQARPCGPTIYYDGSCPLCSAEIRHYQSRDGAEALRFVDVSRQDADLGSDFDAQDAMKRFHVRLPDGTLRSGAGAFVAVWAALPRFRWAARLASLPGVTAILEGAYRIFLPIRPALSAAATRLGARAANPDSDCP